jgi:tripeptidyl-peptidase-1
MESSAVNTIPQGWEKIPFSNDALIRLTFFLKLQNGDKLLAKAKSVSDPNNPDYGNYLTFAEVGRLVTPESKYISRVMNLLRSHGAVESSIEISNMRDVINVLLPLDGAERMLDCKYARFRHQDTGVTVMRAPNGYSLPEDVAEGVSFVAGVIGFPNVYNFVHKQENIEPNAYVNPDTIRKAYNITRTVASRSGKSTQAVASFLEQYFAQSDLDKFIAKFQLVPNTPKVIGPNKPSNPGVEASLDIQYLIAIGENITTTFVYTPGIHEQQEPFLDWITAQMNLGDASAFVHSISYGEYEHEITLDYQLRVDQEFQKFVATGRSILIASGDWGVGCKVDGKFGPVWPGGSPHITSVGATVSTDESGVSFSGGGFSNYFALQDWQKSAVNDYITIYGPKVGIPDAKYYNRTGRGYPDVAAFGTSFEVYVRGFIMPVSGTSASTPLFAGIVSLLNEARFKAGKKQLGFLNPALYSKLNAGFKDITAGRNGYGSCPGFPASEKWDPMTGWGTPNVGKLIELALKL